MKKLAVLLVLLCMTSIAGAETYKWEDATGMHFTDNLASVPKKYRQQVRDNASEDITIYNPSVAHTVSEDNRRSSAKEAREAAAEAAEQRQRQREAAAYWKLKAEVAESNRKAKEQKDLDNKLEQIDRKLSQLNNNESSNQANMQSQIDNQNAKIQRQNHEIQTQQHQQQIQQDQQRINDIFHPRR